MQETLLQLRKELHRHPELSGQEAATAGRIRAFAENFHPSSIISGLGGHGLALVYAFSQPGPAILFRCELDALPIEEANTFNHRSVHTGVSHKCGHDGHMAILAGLMGWIEQQSIEKGKIILLFQPSEENGLGAQAVLNDPAFTALQPDYLFALHNLPGELLHAIITVPDHFSATVQSMSLHLQGKVSHASEPENGISPALAMAEITYRLLALNHTDLYDPQFTLLTPVYSSMGNKAYGVAAGEGELHYTLRTWSEASMQQLKEQVLQIAGDTCQRNSLSFTCNWFDYFPASINNDECNKLITRSALANGFTIKERPYPFKFGEDFGWFSKKYKTALFGIGAGENSPALHHADYDFPDELISTGIMMFARIIHQLLGSKEKVGSPNQ